MANNYHECPRMYLGESDMAQLILRTDNGVKTINFGGDGEYYAYFIDSNEKIDVLAHYACVVDEICAWAWIYDDDSRTQKINFKKDMRLRVYRAGEYGCIIQISEL